ncbi:MAG: NUDIX domain-containing protein [bacterium]|nr:NUDIX domain-containing protein [bacterium]
MSKSITCVDVNGETHDFSVDDLKWRPSTYGVVIKDDKILLSKQFGDKYDLPGGGVELNEKLEDSVIREVKEETGINVKSPKFLGVENNFFCDSHAEGEVFNSILIYYLCEFVGGELSTDGFDEWEKQYAELAEWIPLGRLDEIKPASTIDYRPYVKKALGL